VHGPVRRIANLGAAHVLTVPEPPFDTGGLKIGKGQVPLLDRRPHDPLNGNLVECVRWPWDRVALQGQAYTLMVL
jgi:hypothetical protein